MMLAEWIRYTEPPRNTLARLLEFSLVDSLAPAVRAQSVRTIYDGLGVARQVSLGDADRGWPAVARLIAYRFCNRPLAVLRDRLGTVADLYATAYASMWPAYRPWSNYYSRYDAVFSRWTPEQFDQAQYSCRTPALLQGQFYQRPAIRSRRSCDALLWLHHVGTWYAMLFLRPAVWLTPPVCLALMWWHRVDAAYVWLAVIVWTHLVFRGFLVCADERYELPVDVLVVGWIALTVRTLSTFRHVQGASRLPGVDAADRKSGAHLADLTN